jgi:hypothetical protein
VNLRRGGERLIFKVKKFVRWCYLEETAEQKASYRKDVVDKRILLQGLKESNGLIYGN